MPPVWKTDMKKILDIRIQNVREKIAVDDIDTFMVSTQENRRYLSGFTGEDGQYDETAGVLFITADDLKLATDGRYTLQATEESPNYDVITYDKGLTPALPEILNDLKARRLGFEAERLSFSQYEKIRDLIQTTELKIELVATTDLVESLRIVKDKTEIDHTRQALRMAETVFSDVVRTLRPGMTEQAIAWEMEKRLRETGVDGLAFPVIVASGPNSARPHAIPGNRRVNPSEPILFDWGARWQGYCSDTSRTVILGEPDDTFLSVYQSVREAQEMAIAAIKPEMSGQSVDAVARRHIEAAGFAGKFNHGLGHGTGLAIHEKPRLSPTSDTVLTAGMLCTVEPGIYLPGWGGVRLENQVVVTNNGAEVLNRLGLDDYVIRL